MEDSEDLIPRKSRNTNSKKIHSDEVVKDNERIPRKRIIDRIDERDKCSKFNVIQKLQESSTTKKEFVKPRRSERILSDNDDEEIPRSSIIYKAKGNNRGIQSSDDEIDSGIETKTLKHNSNIQHEAKTNNSYDLKKEQSEEQRTIQQQTSIGKRPSKVKRRKKNQSPFVIKHQHDIGDHDQNCYVCNKTIDQITNNIETKECKVFWCQGCLRSYHYKCLMEVSRKSMNEKKWICPMCKGQKVIRTLEFSRNGKLVSTGSYTSYRKYIRDVCGLTGYMEGCGKCGGPSSQRQIAVLCDNCDREWHIKCMGIEDEDEVPWGNWLCPDCREFEICISCVLLSQQKSGAANDDDEGRECEIGLHQGGPHFYHEGKLVRCTHCSLKYHFNCVSYATPLHLQLIEDTMNNTRNDQQESLELKRSYGSDDEVELKHEPWCCPQCQEFHGIQKIISERRWKGPNIKLNVGIKQKTEEVQLLVKLRNLSYRTVVWLPVDRIRVLYPTGYRKWHSSIKGIKLLQSSDHDGSTESLQNENIDEDNDDLSIDDESISDDENQYDVSNNIKSNSSSIQKVIYGKENNFKFFMRRPHGIKKSWFLPDRVLACRRCPRGSTRLEYLVKWRDLSYQEVTWEYLSVVEHSRALRIFEASECLENILIKRPSSIIHMDFDDPTIIDLQFHTQIHPQIPSGSSLVPGCKYLIKTASSNKLPSETSDLTSNAESKINQEDEAFPISSTLSTTVARMGVLPSLEKREEDFRRGLFVAYVDRPSFLPNRFLFDYQLDGINWLRFAWSRKRSVILADEMGLGKTVQAISFLGSLWNDFATQGPFLIIAPLATLEDVWMREFEHWCPFINVISYFGNPEARERCRELELFHTTPASEGMSSWLLSCFSDDLRRDYDRKSTRPRVLKFANQKRFAKFDAIVTSYEIFKKDNWLFQQINWKVIVVDEGHRLKSFSSEAKRALEGCKSDMRLLLTGTPLQNSIDELFCLLNVLHPEKFPEGCKEDFQDVTQEATIERLKSELQPHILRRIKKDVMGERMPTKKERILRVESSPMQKEIYKNIILRNHVILGSNSMIQKKATRVTSLRNIVMQMRKCCNHPYLFEDVLPVIRTEEDFKSLVESSGKLNLLNRMLSSLMSGGHRVLIFSQFMRMLDILEEYLNYCRYGYERLDGSTSAADRQKAIDRFNTQPQKKFVFLLSTRAGGLGINLTSADTVIIFDSDWNPHNDLQAQARAHRLGQTKKVAIFRFMTRASVEERMIEIARNKLMLDQIVAGRLNPRDAETLVRCGAKELLDDSASPLREISYDDNQLKEILNRDDDDDASSDENDSVESKSGVLDAFRVAHFEERADDAVQGVEEEMASEQFWSNLFKNKELDVPKSIEEVDDEEEELGRGMRARKEVQHYGQSRKSKFSPLPATPEPLATTNLEINQEKKIVKRSKKRKAIAEFQGTMGEFRKDQDYSTAFFSALLLCRLDGAKPSVTGIVSEKDDSHLKTFWNKFRDTIVHLMKIMRGIRRAIGFAETTKLAKIKEQKSEEEEDRIKILDDIMCLTTGCFQAFDLFWDDIWLERLLSFQLKFNFSNEQAFIISHSNRYFIISYPTHLLRCSNHLIAGLREVSMMEYSTWKTRLSLNWKQSKNEGTKSSTKGGTSKLVHFASVVPERPNMSALRNFFNEPERKRRRLNSDMDEDFGAELNIDELLEGLGDTYLKEFFQFK